MNELSANDYLGFLVEIKTRIRQAQYQAFRAVNNELLSLYWDLGESIHQKQEVLGWGKSVVQSLANDLQAEFPGRNGFSAHNLWNMRDFYGEYSALPKLQPLVAEISWAKNLVIMARCIIQFKGVAEHIQGEMEYNAQSSSSTHPTVAD